MTEEELQKLQAGWLTYAGPLEPVIRQVHDLIAEVWRLREALATMTEVAAEHQRREWEANLAATLIENMLTMSLNRIEELEEELGQ